MTTTLRPFDWRDLATLHRYRAQGLCLDAALELTRGQHLASGVLLSYLSSATGLFTWICVGECDDQPLMGQFTYSPDEVFARLTYLVPEGALESPSIPDLLEQLAYQAGERGAFHLLAEIDEQSTVFEILRKVGFAIYARQRIWKLENSKTNCKSETSWKPTDKQDTIHAQSLYHSVVPGLVQQIEPLSSKEIDGLVCQKNGEVIGYVDLKYGPRGIWAQPFIHPDVENVETKLQNMLASIPEQRGRPVYICVRSYQSWLKSALIALEAEPGPSQAVMVKRLAIQQHSPRFVLPYIDGQREITTPLAQSQQNSEAFKQNAGST